MPGPVLGIDLGTTNSVVATADGTSVRVLADSEGNRLIPSVVSFHPNGDVLVGYPARERRLLDARNTVYSVKRLIGRPFQSEEVKRARDRFAFALTEGPTGGALVQVRGETYTLPEISAFVLRQVRAVAESALGEECSRAVITVPANFNELQRSATKAAGRIAGLEVLRILNEPTAAALAYGYGKGSKERVAIYDLGGGTFDITILELSGDVFEVIATAGDTFLGGDDLDLLIADQMAKDFLLKHRYDPKADPQAYERLRAAAEWAKCRLSTEASVQLRVEELAYGTDGISLDLEYGIGRPEFDKLIGPLVARTFDVCEDAMRVAGIRPTTLDQVILVGGATRIPTVQRMVREYFGREPLGRIDPDLVVAQGAAIQGHALAGLAAERAPQALGRVAIKKVSKKELDAQKRPEERKPAGPAFQPRDQGNAQPELRVPPAPPRPPAPPPLQQAAAAARSHTVAGLAPPPPLPSAGRAAAAPPPLPPAAAPAPPLGGMDDLFEDVPTESIAPSPKPLQSNAPSGTLRPPPVAAPPVPDAPLGFGDIELPPVPSQGAPARMAPAGPPAAAIASAAAASAAAPLLLDVTPHSLAIETVAGFCEVVIKRNAAIPVEQTRVFSTGQDNQQNVRVKICQGESRRIAENQELGEIELTGLRAAARGEVSVGVTFVLDADGTLGVKAKDLSTGREQMIRINLVGGTEDEEIARLQKRQANLVATT